MSGTPCDEQREETGADAAGTRPMPREAHGLSRARASVEAAVGPPALSTVA